VLSGSAGTFSPHVQGSAPAAPAPPIFGQLENHVAALGLYFAYYNFCRIHGSLRVTPAMTAGVTTRIWDVEELVALLPPVAHWCTLAGSDSCSGKLWGWFIPTAQEGQRRLPLDGPRETRPLRSAGRSRPATGYCAEGS
jgi:hypothetical protein